MNNSNEYFLCKVLLMDISHYQAFLTVAELGSFSQAADKLHLSQPAVSKRIATLETQYQQQLFDRIGRGIRLTEAGMALMPHARRCLQSIEDARRDLSQLSETVTGSLKLATSHHIGLHRLPPVLKRFTQQYPQVELDIHFMDSEVACQAVEQGQVELAIVTLPDTPSPVLHCKEIWADPLAVLIASTNSFELPDNPSLEQLIDIPAVLPDDRTFTHRIVHQALAQRGVSAKIRLTTNYLETLKMLVGIGLGWSVLPISMADDSLKILDITELNLSRSLGSVNDKRRSLSSAALALTNLLNNPLTNQSESDRESP